MEPSEKQLAELFQSHLTPVYRFLFRLCGNHHDAEDLAQETFLKAWRYFKKYRPEQSFKTWLFAIAHNTAIDWFRKKRELVFSDFETVQGGNALADSVEDLAPLPDVLLVRAEEKGYVDGLLQKLSPSSREVLLLHYEEELTFDEIGAVLAKPLNTVKSQHRRALQALRDLADAPKSDPHP